MSEKIKACPFCGEAEPTMFCERFDGRFRAIINCEGCGTKGAPATADRAVVATDDAIRMWNRRPREERLVKLLRDIRKRVEKKSMLCAVMDSLECWNCQERVTCDEAIMLAAIDAALKEET